MPAAFYEFTIEESSNFASSFKVLNPNTGRLFKFIPPLETDKPWVSNDTQLSFDVPDEIKLVYPNNIDSFGWLKGDYIPSDPSFLIIRMQVKPSVGESIYNVSTTYSKVISTNSGLPTIIKTSSTPVVPFFEIRRNTADHNILLNIPSSSTNYAGKYLYDIELEYRLGKEKTNTNETPQITPFVLRLLQGRMIFNRNITTS